MTNEDRAALGVAAAELAYKAGLGASEWPAFVDLARLECAEHIDGLGCWCRPYRDGIEPNVIVHRKAAQS
jgi:hypothetical protein